MPILKTTQGKVTEAVDAVRWAVSGDDTSASEETRKRARLVGPDCVAFLNYVMRTDGFASVVQRVRAASLLLEVAQFLTFEAKATGLFREDSEGAAEREPS